MVRSLLLVIAILFTSGFEVTPSYAQGCGYHTVYGQVLCRDYKGRSVSTSHCDRYTSEIGSRPPVPSRSCPNPCCTETHTVDGVVVDSEVKVAGSCNSTSRTTTCEERGDCPVATPPTVSIPTPPSTTPSTPDSTPDTTCSYYTRAVDSKNEVELCPAGHAGQISRWYEKFETRQTDCSTSVSGWQLVQTDGSCEAITCPGPQTETRTRTESCPIATQVGSITITESRSQWKMADCDYRWGGWSEVNRSDTCAFRFQNNDRGGNFRGVDANGNNTCNGPDC